MLSLYSNTFFYFRFVILISWSLRDIISTWAKRINSKETPAQCFSDINKPMIILDFKKNLQNYDTIPFVRTVHSLSLFYYHTKIRELVVCHVTEISRQIKFVYLNQLIKTHISWFLWRSSLYFGDIEIVLEQLKERKNAFRYK